VAVATGLGDGGRYRRGYEYLIGAYIRVMGFRDRVRTVRDYVLAIRHA